MLQTNIQPQKSSFKRFVVSTGFYALGRGAESVSRFNKDLKTELEAWPESYTIMLKVAPNGRELWLRKHGDRLKGIGKQSTDADLIVLFKNLDTAFRVISTLSNVHTAFTQNRIMVFGDVAQSMVLIRILNIVQAYLFPPFLSKNVLKRVPRFSFSQHLGRLRVYTSGLLLGM
ncbi:MAG: hypothetical protein GXO89_17425 [Chlorobi bacterium]|nr:hypothetical protein [Chlorobiota bacterium]